MSQPERSKQVTIFEGPDGSGKSTIAREYAERTGAVYVHCGPLPNLHQNLGRLYLETMLPALHGYQDVVLDRCWMSEMPYGHAFREGKLRLSVPKLRMLERAALRCGAVVVSCRPPWQTVKKNWEARKGEEMLKTAEQLRHVYDLYACDRVTDLPCVQYNYLNKVSFADLRQAVDLKSSELHRTNRATAGSWGGQFVLVGEAPGERKDCDPWLQLPFVSFGGAGCSLWLTDQLERANVMETELLWVNASDDLSFLKTDTELHDLAVVALGSVASDALLEAGITHNLVPHPQAWKRFNHQQPYPLIDTLTRLRRKS